VGYTTNIRFLNSVKATAGCVERGCQIDDPRVLEFDHVTGVKNFGLHQVGNRALRTVIAEVMLCEVRCNYHHEFRHYQRSLERKKGGTT
jgi:phosphoribosylaminoimidazole (AIR) synthetase